MASPGQFARLDPHGFQLFSDIVEGVGSFFNQSPFLLQFEDLDLQLPRIGITRTSLLNEAGMLLIHRNKTIRQPRQARSLGIETGLDIATEVRNVRGAKQVFNFRVADLVCPRLERLVIRRKNKLPNLDFGSHRLRRPVRIRVAHLKLDGAFLVKIRECVVLGAPAHVVLACQQRYGEQAQFDCIARKRTLESCAVGNQSGDGRFPGHVSAGFSPYRDRVVCRQHGAFRYLMAATVDLLCARSACRLPGAFAVDEFAHQFLQLVMGQYRQHPAVKYLGFDNAVAQSPVERLVQHVFQYALCEIRYVQVAGGGECVVEVNFRVTLHKTRPERRAGYHPALHLHAGRRGNPARCSNRQPGFDQSNSGVPAHVITSQETVGKGETLLQFPRQRLNPGRQGTSFRRLLESLTQENPVPRQPCSKPPDHRTKTAPLAF
ncbi:MAG: hypothetical protein OXE40_17550, partial [Gammaproteobacteria bacterium]|nr:hypothetical protein [Gammaproteobacteria bacterium]